MDKGFMDREIKASKQAYLALIREINETGHIPSGSPSRQGKEKEEDRQEREITQLKNKIHRMEMKASEWSIERNLLRDKINEATDKMNKATDKMNKATNQVNEVTELNRILLTLITENLNDLKEDAEQTEGLQSGIQRTTDRQTTVKEEDGENEYKEKWDTYDQVTTGNNTMGNQRERPDNGEATKNGLGQRGIGLTEEESKCKQREAIDAINRRKNLILLGHQEESNQIDDLDRRKKDEDYIGRLIKGLLGRDGNKIDYKAHRLGVSNGVNTRPLKISFKDKNTVDRILQKGYMIQKLKGNEKLTLRTDLTVTERRELHEKLNEVRQKNNQRTVQEKEQFFYKVVGGEITKRYIHQPKGRRRRQREQEGTRYSS